MNVHSLKNFIKSKPELIELILEKAGFCHIDDNFSGGIEYRCAREYGKNPTAIRINKETLSATDFKNNINGDLFTLIQNKKNISFPQSVKFISDVVDFKEVDQEDYELPFGGFYKKIKKFRENNGVILETYPESVLEDYLVIPNKMFLQDGISSEVQMKYKLAYDVASDRIVIGWRNSSGEIIGLMGRLNKREVEDGENKYFPIIQFPKSKSLFGFSENYKHIQEKGTCYIFEAEKSPMRFESMGFPYGVALGGSNLSEYQSNNIKSLFVKRIIIGLDEGLDEEISMEMAKKLKMNNFFKNEVYYIYDKNNLIVPKKSKYSPVDLPKQDFEMLLRQCLKKI